jgi:hypothetical protein
MQDIESMLMREKRERFVKDWLEELRSQVRVEINHSLIEKMEIS